MSYCLGVDLGTTFTAAAVVRHGQAQVVPLGDHDACVPSVLALPRSGGVLVGVAAEQHATGAPGTVAREFKRRMGDPTPMVVDGVPRSAHSLTAALLRWVHARVWEREGCEPDAVAVTYPANWGPHRTELLTGAVQQAGLDGALLVTEPEAAALHYASTEHVEDGSAVAVYDLGGGTFDAAVLRRTAEGYRVVGTPAGVEQLGGVDVDAAVFAHVRRSLDPQALDVDPEDTAAMAAVTALRQACVRAKEVLSQDTESLIPVGLPGAHALVRLTRGDLEDMVRPLVAESVTAFRRALGSAGVGADRLHAVLLAGGSSRIPLVGQMLSAELGRPVAVDAHPKHIVALGAALRAATGAVRPASGPGSEPRDGTTKPLPLLPATVPGPDGDEDAAEPATGTAPPDPGEAPGGSGGRIRSGAVAALRSRPALPQGRARRRAGGWAVAGGFAALATVLALAGLPAAATSPDGFGPGNVLLAGRDVTGTERLDVDLSRPLPVSGTVTGPVSVRLDLFDVGLTSTTAAPGEALSLRNSRYLVGGPVRATVRSGQVEHELTVVPEGNHLLTVPGAAAVVLLLFVIAYAESLLVPVRRRHHAPAGTLAGMGLLGVGAGTALAVLGWLLTVGHLLTMPLILACGVAGAGASMAATTTLASG